MSSAMLFLNLRYTDDTTLMAESEEEKWKKESERGEWKSWFKTIKKLRRILSIVKQIASPGLMHETSAQGWYTRMTQRDGMGEGGRRGSQDREHMQIHGWFISMYDKNHWNILK